MAKSRHYNTFCGNHSFPLCIREKYSAGITLPMRIITCLFACRFFCIHTYNIAMCAFSSDSNSKVRLNFCDPIAINYPYIFRKFQVFIRCGRFSSDTFQYIARLKVHYKIDLSVTATVNKPCIAVSRICRGSILYRGSGRALSLIYCDRSSFAARDIHIYEFLPTCAACIFTSLFIQLIIMRNYRGL